MNALAKTLEPASVRDVAPKADRRCSVAFAPYFANNPYQQLLRGVLEAEGVEVGFMNTVEEVDREDAAGDRSIEVLHLHWLPVLKKGPGSWLFAWKQIRALKRLKARRVAIVWTAHNRIPHESVFPKLDGLMSSRVAAMADRIIVHSEAAREEIANACDVRDQGKIELIHHGNYHGVYGERPSKADSRKSLGLEQDEFVFLFLGAVRPHKGVSDLIDAYRMAKLDASLVVAGNIKDKEFERELKEEEARMPGLKILPGFIPDEKLGSYFAAADVVVLPYQRSLTSGALILAMSFGRACIIPDFDTFAEFIDETGGFRYSAGDTGALAAAMRDALAARDKTEALGRRNEELAAQWDWSEVGRLTADVYDQAMAIAGGEGR